MYQTSKVRFSTFKVLETAASSSKMLLTNADKMLTKHAHEVQCPAKPHQARGSSSGKLQTPGICFFKSLLRFPLQNRGGWHPKNLRFWRALLHPYFATESKTMGWQAPKNHPFWTFLDCRKCTKPYILVRELIL